jgi:uncharacterized phage protein (TIGR01671 family)
MYPREHFGLDMDGVELQLMPECNHYKEPFIHNRSGQRSMVYMQFTGLKDKNGKEIWEGDVLLDADRGMRSEGVFFDQGKAAFYAWWKYNKPNDGERTDAFSGGYIGAGSVGQWEVIGNVYSNPELLDANPAQV